MRLGTYRPLVVKPQGYSPARSAVAPKPGPGPTRAAPAGAAPAGAAGVWVVAAVAVLAFVARLLPMLRGGGLSGSDGYDDSVYYTAATALVHGRMPYDDFVLLHPPGLILFLTPFAELARITSDTVGQDSARVAFMALGALNTVLVMRLGYRFSPLAGVLAALLYAVSYPALYAERTTTLEALGATTLLVALTLLVRRHRGGTSLSPPRLSTGRLVGAGMALGAGAGVKIWGVVPLAVVALWVLAGCGRAAAVRLLGAAAATVTAICLPFFVRAPGTMLRYVVADQLHRPDNTVSPVRRLTEMTGLQVVLDGAPPGVVHVALGVILALTTAAAVVALCTPGSRIFVALLVAHAVLLLSSPSFYTHYATLTAAPAALVLAVAAERARRWASARAHLRLPALAAGTALAILGSGIPAVLHPIGTPIPPRLATVASRVHGCVTADDPAYLVGMNVLSRDLAAGCRVWVDVTGLTYDKAGGAANGQVLRTTNRVWQRKVMSYLLSGSATLVTRRYTDLNAASLARIRHLPVLARSHGVTLHRVP